MAQEMQVVKPVQLKLTKEQRAAGEARWEQKINELKGRDKDARSNLILFKYELGLFARELFDSPANYGGHNCQELAGKLLCSKDTIWQAAKFAARYTQDQVKQLIEKNISWHIIPKLLAVNNLAEREALEDKYVGKELSEEEVASEVKAINKRAKKDAKVKGEKPVEGRGGVFPTTIFKMTSGIADSASAKLIEFREAFTDYLSLDDGEKKAKLTALLKMVKTSLRELESQMAKTHKVLEKSK